MYCIETKNLTYRFTGQETVPDNINLRVPQGSVYGFLGPNGAGKTTTLKLVLDLLKKQEGEICLFGRPLHENRVELMKHTGSLIESPSIYGQLTAYENLEVLRRIYRCPRKRIGEVLELVGLAHTEKKRAAKFSLGMKQRLGIAIALLNDPSLLVLDEPTNGLDPNGIIEVRELLLRLNREQRMTIVVSSHLLAEIERIATHVGIIHKGVLMFQGTPEELHRMQAQRAAVRIETNDPQRTLGILVSNGLKPVAVNGAVSIPFVDEQGIAELNRQLVAGGIDVYQLATVRNDLESIFIDLVKR